MAIEKFWERQGPVAFTVAGEEDGLITLDSVICFKVKQTVSIKAIGLPTLQLEVKRVISATQLYVGPRQAIPKENRSLKTRTDLTAYTPALMASIQAVEQSKTKLPPNDIIQGVYEHEPTVAIRTHLVDKIGQPFTSTNPLPTTATISGPNRDGLAILNIPTKNTEVSFSFPNGTKFYQIRTRDSKDTIRMGLSAGSITAGNYWTIIPGNIESPQELMDFDDNYKLYFESKNKDDINLEIHYWYLV